MITTILLAIFIPAMAANAAQPAAGRALRPAEYDAIIALLKPGFNATVYALNRFNMTQAYGLQTDGKPCMIELKMSDIGLSPVGTFDPRGGQTVIEASIHDENISIESGLVYGFSVEPRRTDLQSSDMKKLVDNYVSVIITAAHFTAERRARLTNDTLTVRLYAPGRLLEVSVKKIFGFVTTTEFSCHFAEDPMAHYGAWQRRRVTSKF